MTKSPEVEMSATRADARRVFPIVVGAVALAALAGCGDAGSQMQLEEATAERQADNTVDVTARLQCSGDEEPCDDETCVSAKWYDAADLEEPEDLEINEVERGEGTTPSRIPDFSGDPVASAETCNNETVEPGDAVEHEVPSGRVIQQRTDWWIEVELESIGGLSQNKTRLVRSP